MFLIGDTLVSLDVIEKPFCCDVEVCRGCCCIEGDAGAPIMPEEEQLILSHLEQLKPMMTIEARQVVEEQGVAYNDPSGERVISIVNDKDCIFARTDHEGWCYCIIERAFRDGILPCNKPISCHLYPIRLTQVGDRVGVEYHRWDICHCGRVKGTKQHIPLYQFAREALVCRFGQAWWDELALTATEWNKQCKQR